MDDSTLTKFDVAQRLLFSALLAPITNASGVSSDLFPGLCAYLVDGIGNLGSERAV